MIPNLPILGSKSFAPLSTIVALKPKPLVTWKVEGPIVFAGREQGGAEHQRCQAEPTPVEGKQ